MKNDVDKQMERDCIRQMWPAFALHFVQEVLELTVPLVTSWMVGDIAEALLSLDMGAVRGRFLVFLLAFFLDVFAQPLFRMWKNFVLTKRGFAYGEWMFCRYLRLPLKKAREIEAAALVERIDTDTTYYYFLLMEKWTRPFTFLIYLVCLAGMFLAGDFHPLFILAMVILAAIPVLRAAMNGRKKAALHQAGRDYEEERENMEYGMFGSRDFLNGFRLGGRYIGRFHKKYEEYTKATALAQDRMEASDMMFAYLCAYGVPLGMIAVGAMLILGGGMGIGALLSGYLVIPTLTSFYENLEELILNVKKEPVIRERLTLFYAGADGDGEVVVPREIRLEKVGFTYPNAKEPVFEGFSIRIPLAGEQKMGKTGGEDIGAVVPQAARLHITGKNGAGKSTLLSLLAGIAQPDTGEIVEESGRVLNAESLRRTVSLQEQDGGLFSVSVAENLFIPEEKIPEAEKLLHAMGFEKPMDEVLEEGGGNLSPGERKKLLLVRALLKPAQVLALDEPLNHLDAQGVLVLAGWLKKEERPVLLVSHLPVEEGFWEKIGLNYTN